MTHDRCDTDVAYVLSLLIFWTVEHLLWNWIKIYFKNPHQYKVNTGLSHYLIQVSNVILSDSATMNGGMNTSFDNGMVWSTIIDNILLKKIKDQPVIWYTCASLVHKDIITLFLIQSTCNMFPIHHKTHLAPRTYLRHTAICRQVTKCHHHISSFNKWLTFPELNRIFMGNCVKTIPTYAVIISFYFCITRVINGAGLWFPSIDKWYTMFQVTPHSERMGGNLKHCVPFANVCVPGIPMDII